MGMIHIYCGSGKGKTTAALGLAVRAAGSGMRVHIVQLLKGAFTSEINILNSIPGITVQRCDKDYGFVFNVTESEKNKLISCHNNLLLQAEDLARSGSIDMLIIDEFNAAYEYDLMDRDLADRIVLQKAESLELILTGRNPHGKFLEAADYVSRIDEIKHPYNSGVKARKGIEF